MQTIVVDRARNWITITATGFWLRGPAEALWDEVRKALPALGPGLGRHALICDLTGSGVSPAETIDALRTILTDPELTKIKARHIAMISASALARLQFTRLAAVRPGLAVCTTLAEARSWVEQERARELAPVA